MKFKYLLFLITFISVINVLGQTSDHGDVIYRARNDHAGNLIRVTFHNFGMMGGQQNELNAYTGEWPIFSGKAQLGNASAFVMSEMRIHLADGADSIVTPAIFCQGWDPNLFSHDTLGVFLGFEPLPGYLNISNKEKNPNHAVAMSNQPYTWPSTWPDKKEDAIDPGWGAHWNGYFGKDQKNSDEESFFVMDDYHFKKRLSGLKLPLPIASEPERG
ncbi:MAG: hypothetical protein Q8K40_01630, partial [Ignavibacteria bacterium]|nr:hypothetical protein [Ignavibacteria bacterium]